MTSSKAVCGFCHKGGEESSTSGRLFSHEAIHAHLRCMQYSSGLAQYQKGRYPQLGGFKWSQVRDELKRGSHLKCHVCGKRKGAVRGATAGCTIRKCSKTFHFTCAALDKTAITKRIVVHSPGEDEKVFYRVFCGKAHFQIYENHELKKLGAFEYQSDSEDDEEEEEDDESGNSDPQSSSKDTMMQMKDSFSVVGAIYPRIKMMAEDTDTQSEDSNEIVFNPRRILVAADVHGELDSHFSNRSLEKTPCSPNRRSPRASSSQLSPISKSPVSPRKSPRSVTSWGSISRGDDEIVSLVDQTHDKSDKDNGTTSVRRKVHGKGSNGTSPVKQNDSVGTSPVIKTRKNDSVGTSPVKPKSPSEAFPILASKTRSPVPKVNTSPQPKKLSPDREVENGTHLRNSESGNVMKGTRNSLPIQHTHRRKSGFVFKRDSVNGALASSLISVKNIEGNLLELPNLSVSLVDCVKATKAESVQNGAVKALKRSPRSRKTLDDFSPERDVRKMDRSPGKENKNTATPAKADTKEMDNSSPGTGSTKGHGEKRRHTRSCDGPIQDDSSPITKRSKQDSEGSYIASSKMSPKKPDDQKPGLVQKMCSRSLAKARKMGELRSSTPVADTGADRNESFDLTPENSSTPSISGDHLAAESPVPRFVSQLQQSRFSNMSSGSETDTPSKSGSPGSGRQRYSRRAARRSRQLLRERLAKEKQENKQPDNVQAMENVEISTLLKGLPAWQAWLQQAGGSDAHPLRAVCFLESPLPSNQVLHRVLLRSFGIDEQDIFTWQPPDSLQLSQQHMLHIMKDIAANLQTGEIAEVQRIMLKLGESDIQKYTKDIQFGDKYIFTDLETRQKIQSKMWNAVRDCLQEGCLKTGIVGGILNLSDVNILVLLLNRTLDPEGDIYKSMLNFQSQKVSLFSFGENNLEWQVNLRPRHTQEMYMEEEQTTICRWLLAHVDSSCGLLVQPIDAVMQQDQLSVNNYLKQHLPQRLPSSGKAKASMMVILVGPVNLDIVNISEYCLHLIPYLLDCYSDMLHLFVVIDLGELEGAVIRAALVPDLLPDDVTHRVWMAADPKVLPVSCLVVQLTRKGKLTLASSSTGLP